ncbi:MAG: NAD(+)/NADH kinase [Candidatus Heimdallarchaeota archaeon]
MKIALYITEDKNTKDFADTIKEVILETEPETEIVEIQDKIINEGNWDNLQKTFLTKDADCIITIGDTGTFLRAIFLSRNPIPVVAASSERISFFTEIAPNNMRDTLQAVLSEKYLVDDYYRVELQDARSRSPITALNEIALFPKDSALLMSYTLVIDNNVLYRGRADGIIVSTALGSTGYALSSGGPIAFGSPDILIIVPVNPLNKDHIPLVVPNSSDIKLTHLRSRSHIEAVVDGQIRVSVEEEISIRKSPSTVKIIRFQSRKNILAKLRNRLVELDLRHLEGVPPSAKYIFKLLLTEGEMTQKELIESTGLPNRTVRNALNILKEKGVISQRPHLRDARQSIYFVS